MQCLPEKVSTDPHGKKIRFLDVMIFLVRNISF